METPIQIAIRKFEEATKEYPISINRMKQILTEILPIEREVIEKVAIDMVNISISKMENKDFTKGMEQEFNEYFETTFKIQ